MKTLETIVRSITKIIGRDNNRFYGLLLFLALMFTLWIIYQNNQMERPTRAVAPKQAQPATSE
jgi:hypothetical protein